jgi:TetR/AcrR family transcriptional regulator of autoinduction and epiphytic fitness
VGSATPRSAPVTDGRNARAERTRAALVDAMLTLLDGGDLKPTAERIAARAGVSERTLWQHFRDREALFQASALAQAERIGPLIEPLPAADAPLLDRLDAFVMQRARVLERLTPVRRGALQLEASSETVAGWLRAVRAGAAAQVAEVFAPELSGRDDREELLAALVAASAWTTWESLRAHQGLSTERAAATLQRTLAALLGCF